MMQPNVLVVAMVTDAAARSRLALYHRSNTEPSFGRVHDVMALEVEPWLDHKPGRKGVMEVDDRAELGRLHRAEGLGISAIAVFGSGAQSSPERVAVR
jgi:hypothetical protein